MLYKTRTQEEILAELQDLTESPASVIEGTFNYDVLSSNAIEFAKFSLELSEVYRNSFLHTCTDEYLDLRAEEIGVYRRPANKAKGYVTVVGDGTVYAGAIFATAAGTRFIATETVKVDGTAKVAVEAEPAGNVGNVAAGTINKMPMNIAGIRSVSNAEATYDGYDQESDDSLRERALMKARLPAASGSPQHYIEWATSIVGVGAARCQRCWAGPGTVKVVISDANLEEANVDLLQRVYEYIESQRPVGAEVTVISAISRPINISAKITGTLDLDAFTAGVIKYFKSMVNSTLFSYVNAGTYETFKGNCYVSISQINSYLIAEGGAEDVHELLLNGAAEDVQLNIDEIPQIGELNFE